MDIFHSTGIVSVIMLRPGLHEACPYGSLSCRFHPNPCNVSPIWGKISL